MAVKDVTETKALEGDDIELSFEELTFSASSPSMTEKRFWAMIENVQDTIVDLDFRVTCNAFMDKHFEVFVIGRKRNPAYKNIYMEYIAVVKSYLDGIVEIVHPGFDKKDFWDELQDRKDQVCGPIINMLLTFISFPAFRTFIEKYTEAKILTSLRRNYMIHLSDLFPEKSYDTQARDGKTFFPLPTI